MTNETIFEALTEKIQRLEQEKALLLAKRDQASLESVRTLMNLLRKHGVILLNLGNDTDLEKLYKSLIEDGDGHLAQQLSYVQAYSLFSLDRAPIEPAQRDAIRTAFNGGCSRY